ncbi:hypothetical protein JD844_024821 [Phrynosoma platyrhinos]|uniref:Conserved oligomeric Golgi complex subunit 2 n=1 Tax=Phrynosoma platyrhinos TaxID=52577 RepID=A0ABQ7SYU3_PHRPL|nr:hypothetical protein JD844_024821 [Phrynosoma platyrhinos]
METRNMNLPRGPENLCFDKDEFMKPNFDVDHFVSECRKRVQLEELRDDLELYYKLLKTAMIELINKDYADFVNLSTNLVGMDKALNQLSVPLGQLREEVMRIVGITAMLQQSLEGLLLEGLQTSNIDIIRHCLRTYATIDKTRDAEALVGEVLVKPYVDEVIVEQYVQSHPNGLQTMYNKLLEFVPLHCRLLREVTGGGIPSERGNTVPGYDFLVNSVWPEIVRGLEVKLPSLFNPGNPDAFHEKYTISMDFVRKFERQCGSQASVKRLRLHPSYQSFNDKWNLPVYFQIRNAESYLVEYLHKISSAGSSYHLLATHMVWASLQKCWSAQIFLPLLVHRLWKLSLQIVARYSVFVNELLLRPISNESTKDHRKILTSSTKESPLNLGSVEDQGNESAPDTQPLPSISTAQLVLVAADLDHLQEWV